MLQGVQHTLFMGTNRKTCGGWGGAGGAFLSGLNSFTMENLQKHHSGAAVSQLKTTITYYQADKMYSSEAATGGVL